MDRRSGHGPSPGLFEEEHRRQLAAELERAERERRAALLLAAEAEARADQVRKDLARSSESRFEPTRHGHTVRGRVTPLYGGVPEPRSTTSDARSVTEPSGSMSTPTSTMGARRAQLLERFIDADAHRPTRWPFAVGVLALAVMGTFTFLNSERIAAAGEDAVARWVLPRVRPELQGIEVVAAPELLADEAGSALLLGFVTRAIERIDERAGQLGVSSTPTTDWLTPAYRVRPTEHADVRTRARGLVQFSTDAQGLVPSLAEADNSIRAEFSQAGIQSEGLAQDGLRVYGSMQRVLLAKIAGRAELGLAMTALDDLLRTHQGTLTFRLGEYGHRDLRVADQAASLEAAAIAATEAAALAEELARSTLGDLGMPGR